MLTVARQRLHIRDLIRPLPSQARFLDALQQYEYILFGGAAGPGKSYVLRWALIELQLEWAAQGHRDVRVGLFCEDYPSLMDRQINRIKREFPPWLGILKESRDEGFAFHLDVEYGGGIIALRNLADPAKYASAEFAAIAVDELTKNSRQTFDDLRFRKRWPGIEHSPFLAASNPGSIGHAWVKKLWVDRDFSGDDSRFDPDSFLFIPARAGENPYLPQSYWDTLNSLPTDMRRAMLEGDWNVFAGQVFSEWRHDLHVCRPFLIPPDWTRWVAIDYGFAAPFCGLWFARNHDDGTIYVYRELYETDLSAREQARRIRLASGNERIRLYAADPSMWARREGRADAIPKGIRATMGTSVADDYASEGIHLSRADNNRRDGLSWVHEALAWSVEPRRLIKPPRLQVFESCANLIRTLPTLPYDRINTEDVDTDAEDHAYDALRYGLGVPRRKAQPIQAVAMEFR